MDKIVEKIVKKLISEVKKEDIDPKLITWIENKYGPWNDRDFISDDGDTYFKTDKINKETGSVSHTIIDLPTFSELIKQLKITRDVANELIRGESVRDDEILRDIYNEQRKIFNKFRTHLRKEYPAFYAQLKGQLTEEELVTESKGAKNYFDDLIFYYQKAFRYLESDEKKEYQRLAKNYFSSLKEMSTTGGGAGSASSTPGKGMQYATPYAFKKVKKQKLPESKDPGKDLGPGPKASEDGVKDNAYVKQFGYKLVPKKIKGSGLEVKQLFEKEDAGDFQNRRIQAFDRIEQEMNDIYKMLSNAKNETSDYYNENPGSYSVVKPTDLVLDYIKDIKDLLKGE